MIDFIPEQEYQTISIGDSLLPAKKGHVVRIVSCDKPVYLNKLPYKINRLDNRDKVFFEVSGEWFMAKCLMG